MHDGYPLDLGPVAFPRSVALATGARTIFVEDYLKLNFALELA